MVTKVTAPKKMSPPLGPKWHFAKLPADNAEKALAAGQPRKVSGKGFGKIGFWANGLAPGIRAFYC